MMSSDPMTKYLLAAIAAALWLHLLLPLLLPGPAVAGSASRVEIVDDVKIRGEIIIRDGKLAVDLDRVELDTYTRPLQVQLKQ